jgi:hypothetical protein
VTIIVQPYTMAVSAVLFGLSVLIGTVITRTADSQASVDQEKIQAIGTSRKSLRFR